MDQGNSQENGASAAAKPATWVGHGGAAAFDLRSDTQTTPTAAMLAAISVTTLDDDVYNEDKTTIDLEARVAELAGKEAALFVLSGTMGNQLALRSLLIQPPHSVLCDHRSHIIRHEAGGVASLSQAMIEAVVPRNGIHLTLEDVKEHACIGDNVHDCPTRVISLENTLGGMIMPLDEVRRISAWAREHGIRMHCDGARLWEVVASGGGSLRDFAECFDTVNLCFSKGLGAPIGSIIVGPKDVLKHSRWMRKAIGGGLRQSGVVTAAARVAVDVTFGAGPNGEGGAAEGVACHGEAVHTNMLWLDLESMGCSGDRFTELGVQQGLKLSGNRIITHYQVGEEAIQKLTEVFKQVAAERNAPPKLGPKHANDTGVHVYKV
ncbi:hypothetical protein PG993_001508 [Apiospora rasikravindrae]|uniref:Aromatic amino acid beta-eliminating lyase/threonine aldolase domain-containing protein n=1 Tax=Apiospora rasikravindrae TaxID=990691 RepID=A0ABR1UBM3_9PEZI